MLKKFFAAVVFVICAGIFNFCSAATLFQIYENDPNYKLGAAYSNARTYIEWQTITVVEYNPPHYQISARAVDVVYDYDSNKTVEKKIFLEKRYNWYTKETFTRNDYGNWEKDEVVGNGTPSRQNRQIANLLFRAAYGMNFYD